MEVEVKGKKRKCLPDREELDHQVMEYIQKEYKSNKTSGSGKRQDIDEARNTDGTASGIGTEKDIPSNVQKENVSAARSSAASSSQIGRKDMKRKKKVLSPEERAERNRRAADVFNTAEEVEKKAQEKTDEYELEF